MTAILVGWKSASDPASPWTRLTRQGKLIRTTSSFANHLVATGSATHEHDGAGQSWSCGYGTLTKTDAWDGGEWPMYQHTHTAPSSWDTNAQNNDPPWYGIDLIYMDADLWETAIRSFPANAILFSAAALSDANLSRLSAADGKFIKNTEPTTTGGSSSTHAHTASGTTGSSGGDTGYYQKDPYPQQIRAEAHTHTCSATSDSKYPEPAYLQTRIYEVTSQTNNALTNTVVFFSATPSAIWEVLTGWANRLLKGGDSDPTTGGSDQHYHDISGTSSAMPNRTLYVEHGDDEPLDSTENNHTHSFSGRLANAYNIPACTQLVPARLTVTIQKVCNSSPKIIGL